MNRSIFHRPFSKPRLHLERLENRITPVTYTVTNLLDSGAGSLRQALISSNSTPTTTDVVDINVNGTITLLSELSVTDDVSIIGNGADKISISGNNAVRVFNISGGNTTDVVLDSLTITKGKVTGDGAGILNNAKLTLAYVALRGNSASNEGGGVLSQANASLTVYRCEISGNSATAAGGGLCTNGGTQTVLINNSTLSGNSTGGVGGGFCAQNWAVSSSFTMQNSTVTKNTSAGNGGGLRVTSTGAALTIESSVINGNTGAATAPEIFAGTVNLTRCLVGNVTGFTVGVNSNNLTAGTDPMLGALADNGGPTFTHKPAANSPLRDKGSNSAGAITDQRGNVSSRMQNAVADIGAFELNSLLVVRNTNDAGIDSLRQQVTDADNVIDTAQTITFDAAFFNSAKTIKLGTFIPIGDELTINGEPNRNVIVSGNNVTHMFEMFENATFNNLVFTNGRHLSGAGGAIYIYNNATLHINDCTIQNCTASSGGGIAGVNGATLYMTDCLVQNNVATSGDGGGIKISHSVEIVTSTVMNNTANGKGGGIYSASLTLYASTVAGNSSGSHGGGIQLVSEPGGLRFFRLESSTISANTSAGKGGGLNLGVDSSLPFEEILDVFNCTIVNNKATVGGGIRHEAGGATNKINIYSTIVSGNSGGAAPGISYGWQANVNFSAIGSTEGFDLTGANNIPFGVDLKLSPLGAHGGPTLTHRPAPDSPVIGQGNAALVLPTDQRGFPRTVGSTDIGSVELSSGTVTSIVRNSPNPATGLGVSWLVTTSPTNMGVLNSANFTITGSGAAAAGVFSVTSVSSPNTSPYVVTAIGISEGDLVLNLVNDQNLNHALTNLPFVGQSFTVDKVALAVNAVAVNDNKITDADVGPAKFNVTVTYSEAMDTTVPPAVDFPNANTAGSLVFASGEWLNATQYRGTYNVNDLNVAPNNIDVRVTGGKDSGGSVYGTSTKLDVFSIDTRNPVAMSILRNNPNSTNQATVGWTVTFSEAITGLSAANFSLFNGGLTGSPAITLLSGSGMNYTVSASTGGGQGALTLVVDNGEGVTDINGNYLANTPISGGAYAIDHVVPAVAKITSNVLTITDANVGPAGFTLAVQFNEPMNQAVNPVISFSPVNPAPTLTFASGAWLDAKTFRATYSVVDFNVEIADIDVNVTGAKDAVGNVQSSLLVDNLFDIDMKSPTVAVVKVNDGSAQRSRVTSLTVTFSELVNLPSNSADAFSLSGSAGAVNLSVDTGGSTATQTIVALTFSGPATESSSLKDGRYTLHVFGTQVSDLASNALVDYTLVGDPATNKLFRLFGDSNGDGTVNGTDFLAFRLAFLGTGSTFDFDGSGQVTGNDFLQFRLRFLQSI